jgi:hypothetical protein
VRIVAAALLAIGVLGLVPAVGECGDDQLRKLGSNPCPSASRRPLATAAFFVSEGPMTTETVLHAGGNGYLLWRGAPCSIGEAWARTPWFEAGCPRNSVCGMGVDRESRLADLQCEDSDRGQRTKDDDHRGRGNGRSRNLHRSRGERPDQPEHAELSDLPTHEQGSGDPEQ